MRLGCCLPSRDYHPRRPCTISLTDIPRRSRARRKASRSLCLHLARVLAALFCRCIPGSMRSCWVRTLKSMASMSGSLIQAGPVALMALVNGWRSTTRGRLLMQLWMGSLIMLPLKPILFLVLKCRWNARGCRPTCLTPD